MILSTNILSFKISLSRLRLEKKKSCFFWGDYYVGTKLVSAAVTGIAVTWRQILGFCCLEVAASHVIYSSTLPPAFSRFTFS